MTNKYSHPTDLNSNPNKYPEMPGNYNPQNHSDNQNTGFREFSEYAQPTDLNPQKKQPSQYPDLYKKEPQKTDNEKKAHKVNFEPEAIKGEEKKANENFGQEDLAKSIFKANQASTNFRKLQSENYRSIYKNNPVKTKLLDHAIFPANDPKEANHLLNEGATNLARSFIGGKESPNFKRQNGAGGALGISVINKTKGTEKKEGYLLKRNRYFFQKWTRRFCKVKNRKFLYYDVNNLDHCLGCIDFDGLTIEMQESKKENTNITDGFTFHAKNSYKVFTFKIAPEDEKKEKIDEWIRVLAYNLKHSEGLVKEIQNRDIKYKYWKSRVISLNNFKNKVDTFDILLFRGLHNMAKVQRFFTGSDYDHVAIFLRSGIDVYFLEATGTDGVGLCNWETFVENKWNLLYERLVFRHLKVERTPEMLQTFQDFMLSVIQSEYEISIKKLLKFQSSIGKPEDYKGRTFFCSELVASGYKILKFLNENISATQYWPGSFSKENKSLPLSKSCKLCDEYLIEF